MVEVASGGRTGTTGSVGSAKGSTVVDTELCLMSRLRKDGTRDVKGGAAALPRPRSLADIPQATSNVCTTLLGLGHIWYK